MTYEGARCVIGPYLGILGASGAVVGFVSGFDEFLGYALRLVSGYISDRTAAYWAITIAGYGINLFAVPLLALTGRRDLAVLMIVAERAGKAIRTPAATRCCRTRGGKHPMGWDEIRTQLERAERRSQAAVEQTPEESPVDARQNGGAAPTRDHFDGLSRRVAS